MGQLLQCAQVRLVFVEGVFGWNGWNDFSDIPIKIRDDLLGLRCAQKSALDCISVCIELRFGICELGRHISSRMGCNLVASYRLKEHSKKTQLFLVPAVDRPGWDVANTCA